MAGGGFVKHIGSDAQTTAGSTLTVTVPAGGVPAGDMLFAAVVTGNTASAPTITDTGGNTYTRDRTAPSTGSTHRLSIFSCRVGTALAAGATITIATPSVAGRVAAVDQFTGLIATDPYLDATDGGSGTNTTPSLGSDPAVQANELQLGILATNGPTTDSYTQSPGYTGLTRVGTTGLTLNRGYRVTTVTDATPNYAPTLGTARTWIDFLALYKTVVPSTALPITASGSGASGGSVDLSLKAKVASTGTSTTGGSATFAIPGRAYDLTAAGSGQTAGFAALALAGATTRSYRTLANSFNPEGSYRFSEASGTTTADSSGHGHTGTIAGNSMATYTTTASATAAADGDRAFAPSGGTSSTFTTAGTWPIASPMTVTCWVNLFTTQGTLHQVSVAFYRASDNANCMFVARRNTSGSGNKISYWNSTAAVWREGNAVLSLGAWHHIAYVINGNSISWYVDGVLDATDSTATVLPVAYDSVRLAAQQSTGGVANPMRGTIDEVDIYTTALSAQNIADLYAARLAVDGGSTGTALPVTATGTGNTTGSVALNLSAHALPLTATGTGATGGVLDFTVRMPYTGTGLNQTDGAAQLGIRRDMTATGLSLPTGSVDLVPTPHELFLTAAAESFATGSATLTVPPRTYTLTAAGTGQTSGAANPVIVGREYAITGAGIGQTTGGVTIGVGLAVGSTGQSFPTGSVALTARIPLAALGGSLSAGSVALTFEPRTYPITAAGTSQTAGAANPTVAARGYGLTGAGIEQTQGAVALLSTLVATATGTSDTAGAVALNVRTTLTAAGASSTAGAADVTVAPRTYGITATGAGATTGAAALTIPARTYPVTATGTTQTGGGLLFGGGQLITSTGLSTTTGAAALTIPPRTYTITTTGTGVSAGAVALTSRVRVTAAGTGTTGGQAILAVGADYTGHGIEQTQGQVTLTGILAVTAAGSTTTVGNAPLVRAPRTYSITAEGHSTQAGSVALRTTQGLTADGDGTTTGALDLRVAARSYQIGAAGVAQTTGAAALTHTRAITAHALEQLAGAATMNVLLSLAAAGQDTTHGSATVILLIGSRRDVTLHAGPAWSHRITASHLVDENRHTVTGPATG